MGERLQSSWVLLGLLFWVLLPQEGNEAQVRGMSQGFSPATEDFQRQWQQEIEDFQRQWDRETMEMQRWWEEYQRQAAINWEEYRRETARMWDEFRRTTAKVWADYSADTEARTVVDFAQGTIDVEVVVPSAEPNAFHKAADRVKEKFLESFAKKVSPGRSVLEGQLRAQSGLVVTPQNVERFADTEVKGNTRVGKRFQGQDGIERLKVTTRIPMAHEHIHHRAQWYAPLALKYGQERQVPPARVLAIMHTESAFNPFARSTEGAIGLMQLMPHTAARDAYEALYGEPKVVSAAYLYKPENNVNLGTVYVTLLRDRYLGDIQDLVKRDYLVICAYNWGIGHIMRLVGQANRISREEVAAILRRHTPQETRDYLDRVLRRTMLYEPMAQGR